MRPPSLSSPVMFTSPHPFLLDKTLNADMVGGRHHSLFGTVSMRMEGHGAMRKVRVHLNQLDLEEVTEAQVVDRLVVPAPTHHARQKKADAHFQYNISHDELPCWFKM